MLKKQDLFFELLENIASNINAAANYFHSELITKESSLAEFAEKMKEYETKGDQFTHTMIISLNKTFSTPIEREDILALTSSLDDVMDGIEASVARLDMYQIYQTDEFIMQFAENLVASAKEIDNAIGLLRTKKLLAIREHTVRLNELENLADDLLRAGIRSLFANVKDPIELIKKKEIYELLEATTDDCEDVANTLETIIMRNA